MNEIIIDIIKKTYENIETNKDYLTDLDRAIGDGDHGVNISRGMKKLAEDAPTYANLSISDVFNKIAMTLISNVGGASGALYGTCFMKMGMTLKGKENLSKEDIPSILEAGIGGIMSRGKSTAGEKTMLETLIPFCESLKANLPQMKVSEAFEIALTKACEGRDSTRDMLATKGRASYLKERSIGHLDPGSVSSYIILETITEILKGEGL